jgi:nucleoside-diphosphate-sugar epimerase/aryl carrier-like protein
LPKPIVLSPRYPLLYAACHEFPADEHVDWTNLSTLPLYHGFGLLAPCLALSVGMTCCFPPSSIIPAGYSTLALMEAFDCRSLMTVPSIVGELLAIMPPNDHDGSSSSSSSSSGPSLLLPRRLRTLEFLAVGGGTLAADHGLRLVGAGVRLINHYGVTEIGPLAPIFRPGHEGDDDNDNDNDYNWRYLRLRSDLDLQLRPAPGSLPDDANNHRCRLVGWSIGCGGAEAFEIQDDLERNPDARSGRVEVRILGRTDDVIVLKTGEKVLPQRLETALGALPSVQTAVCLGQGQFEVVVLVEPAAARDVDMDDGEKDAFVSAVWEVVARVNPTLDRHACVTSKAAIIVKPPGKAVPRTDKGSVSRKMVHDVFADEMRAAYRAMENEAAGAMSLAAAGGGVASGIRRMVLQVLARGGDDGDDDDMDADQDLFERGMDSLQALRLARLVKSAVTSLRPDRAAAAAGMASSADFIYRHPSIAKLTKAVQQLLVPDDNKLAEEEVATTGDDAEQQERSSYMRSLVATFTANMTNTAPPVHAQAPPRLVVLLTGATGALGVNVLASLVKRGHVSKVICVGRCQSTTADDADGPKKKNSGAILARLQAAVLAAGIPLEEHHWDKIETVEDRELLQSTTTTTPTTTLSRLAAQVTHIVHMAWPIDFRRKLHSFGPHLRMLTTLLELARRAHAVNPGRRRRVRLSFVSSIATVEHYAGAGAGGGPTRVPERITDDPATAAPMGYAEAKWVCEHMTAFAADAWRDEMEAVVVRVGQLSGAEQNGGLWKTGEHIPALVNASRRIGAVPLLKGVSGIIGLIFFFQNGKQPPDHVPTDRLLDPGGPRGAGSGRHTVP